jgi:hypothetical protein
MSNKIAIEALTDAKAAYEAWGNGTKKIDAAIAALEAMEAGGWLPIANAPKDCEILLFCKFCGVVRGRWNDCRYANKPRPYWTHDRERVFGVAACRSDQPTHWVPLPTPPKD